MRLTLSDPHEHRSRLVFTMSGNSISSGALSSANVLSARLWHSMHQTVAPGTPWALRSATVGGLVFMAASEAQEGAAG
jgi:hypothetical protein